MVVSIGQELKGGQVDTKKGKNNMKLFREYGTTKEEIRTTLEDAIRFVNDNDNGSTENLSDRLLELANLFEELTKDYEA